MIKNNSEYQTPNLLCLINTKLNLIPTLGSRSIDPTWEGTTTSSSITSTTREQENNFIATVLITLILYGTYQNASLLRQAHTAWLVNMLMYELNAGAMLQCPDSPE